MRSEPPVVRTSPPVPLFISFLSGDPRLPDIAGIQTRFSRRGQSDYGFDARGLRPCVLGTSLFWKVQTCTCSNQLFFPPTHALGKHFVCVAQFIGSINLPKEWRNFVWGTKTWQWHLKPASQMKLHADLTWSAFRNLLILKNLWYKERDWRNILIEKSRKFNCFDAI
jgi:hypothetical protein